MKIKKYRPIDLDDLYKKNYDLLTEKYLFLKPNTGKPANWINTKLISFDTEAKRIPVEPDTKNTIAQEIHEMYVYDFFTGDKHYTGKDYLHFTNSLKYLLKKYKKITVLIHNAKYDTSLVNAGDRALWVELLQNGFTFKNNLGKEIKITVYKQILDNVYYLSLQDKNHNFVLNILDSTNFFKSSLRDIAKAYGQKFTTENEYKSEPEKWNAYLTGKKDPAQQYDNGTEMVRSDTELLYNFFTDFVENSKNTLVVKNTSAGTSMATFKKKFLQENIWIEKDLANTLLPSYHWGRTESYVIGFDYEPHKVLDVSSLYPTVMRKHKYSTYPIEQVIEPSDQYIAQMTADIAQEKYNYFIECTFNFKKYNLRYPIAVKHKKTGKLVFPKSCVDPVIITGREFFIGLINDAEFEIKRIWKFVNADLFSGYVDHFYNLKANAKNSVEKTQSKLMLNSVYGKFSQHKSHQVAHTYDNNRESFILKKAYELGYSKMKDAILYPTHYYTKTEDELIYPVMIGIEITANARLYNYEIQSLIGFQNLWATDTDSFHVRRSIAQKLHAEYPEIFPEKAELGQLAVENFGLEQVNDVKDYQIIHFRMQEDHSKLTPEAVVKQKGVNGEHIEGNLFKSSQWQTMKSKNGQVTVKNIRKRKSYKRDKLAYVQLGKTMLGLPLLNEYDTKTRLTLKEALQRLSVPDASGSTS